MRYLVFQPLVVCHDYQGSADFLRLIFQKLDNLQGMMVIYTLIVVLVNLITDLTYGLIDPRIKYR